MSLGVNFEVWALLAIIVRLMIYAPYFYEIIKGKCHPHSFSWFTWFIIDFIAFLVQFYEGAGAGAYATLSASLISLAIALLGWFIGNRDIKKLDIIAFFSAIAILPIWYFLKSSLAVIILLIIIEFLGSIPTLRKATYKPHEERSYVFFGLALASIFTLLAIENRIIENMLYPAYLMLIGLFMGAYVVWRGYVMSRVKINTQSC